eukprot:SAG25_NODE_427_length_8159_cov_9.134491_8_plen_92_part_00
MHFTSGLTLPWYQVHSLLTQYKIANPLPAAPPPPAPRLSKDARRPAQRRAASGPSPRHDRTGRSERCARSPARSPARGGCYRRRSGCASQL